MGTKRLTRKEIVQEDRIHATLSSVWDWAARNSTWIVVALGVFILAIVGSYFWQYYQKRADEGVQKQLGEALEIHHAPVGTAQNADGNAVSTRYRFKSAEERHRKALEKFNAIAQEHSSTQVGTLARYYVALNKQELGQKEEARKILAEVSEQADDVEIKNLARYALAGQAKVDQNHAEAIRRFKEILDAPASNFPKQTVLLELAQTYEARGNTEEALKTYRKITVDYPGTEYSRQAQDRLTQLEPPK